MRIAGTIALWLARVCGVIQIILGLLFWSGNARTLVQVHMLVGIILVLALWTLAGLAAASGANPILVIVSILWGIIMPVLGLTQARILPGSAHWLIQILHLAVGIAALALAQVLGTRILRGAGRGPSLAAQA